MPTQRGQFGQLLAPGFNEIMFDWLSEHPEEYSQFLNVETSDGAYEEDQIIAAFGLIRQMAEGQGITYDDPIQGPSKRYIHDPYGLGWQISREMLRDEKYSIMAKMPGAMVKSARQTWEQIGANVLNGSFLTTLVADGLSLCNTAHPLLGGGTYGNRLSPDADISVTSVQDALLLFEGTVDERNLKARLIPKILWLPFGLQFIASRVLHSEYDPETGNNAVNTVQGRLEPRVLHWLTATTPWWVTSSPDEHHMKFYWREKLVTDTTDDFETKGVKHSVYFRCSAGATHWNGIVGSNP